MEFIHIPETEKENYIYFHKKAYEEDLKHSKRASYFLDKIVKPYIEIMKKLITEK